MAKIEMYKRKNGLCPYCDRAEALLTSLGCSIIFHYIDESQETLEEMLTRSSGAKTIPQIFIDGRHIGGYDALAKLHSDGELTPLLGS